MTRLEAHAGYRRVLASAAKEGPEQKKECARTLCLKDPFFRLVYVLSIVPREIVDNDWVYDRTREVQKKPWGYADLWCREHFKDIDSNEPILTANRGWIRHGDVLVGDTVFSPEGKQVKVLGVSEQFTNHKCLQFTFQDHAKIVCGEGHLWRIVQHKHGKRNATGYRKPLRVETVLEAKDVPLNSDIGVLSSPIEYPDALLPIQPYVMGAWIGDGHSAGPRITCSDKDSDIVKRIEGLGYKCIKVKQSNERCPVYGFGGGICGKKGTGITPIMRNLGVLNNKHIPDIYKQGSKEQRTELLRGLMDTDGTCSPKGGAVFCNVNERLARDVYELMASLALRPRIGKYKTSCNGKIFNFFQVSCQGHSDRNIFHLKRKSDNAITPSLHRKCRRIKKIESVQTRPTNCIYVEGGMYLVGKQLLPTHNTTIITQNGAIGDILNDPEGSTCIFSFKKPNAKKLTGPIGHELENNQRLKDLFPDILFQDPLKDSPKWTQDEGIVVKRKYNPTVPTLMCSGLVEGQPTGMHFKYRRYDDVETIETVRTPDGLNKCEDALKMSYNLGITGIGKASMVGTVYTHNDIHLRAIKDGTFKPRIYPATKNGELTGEPWLWTKEQLAAKMRAMGPYIGACQLFLRPTADGMQSLQKEWLRYWKADRMMGLNFYILVDPASEKKDSSDYSVFIVVGMGSDRNYYVTRIVRDRLNLQERANVLFKLHQEYRPIAVGYEKYGMQADIQYMMERMDRQNYRFSITPLAGQMPKNDRIKRLVPAFSEGRIYLPEAMPYEQYDRKVVDLSQAFVNDEFLAFPYSEHDDMLDALSRIMDDTLGATFPQGSPIDVFHIDAPREEAYDILWNGLR